MFSRFFYTFSYAFTCARAAICVWAFLLLTGLNFNVSAQDCFYAIQPTSTNVSAAAGTGSFLMTVDAACIWNVSSNAGWITVTTKSTGYGDAIMRFSYQANSGAARQGTITVQGGPFTVNQAAGTVAVARAPFDFDGDNKTDLSIFRPPPGEWWYLRSSNGGNYAAQFGASTDKLTPGDYTGDGKADIAFWRPSTGEWFILRSEDSSYYSFPFGTTGDIPAPADYDGDTKTDATVFRPSSATWFISRSSGGTTIQSFGASGDKPVPADYDADGKADIAIYRPGPGEWWLQRSTAGTIAFQFGNSSDKPEPGDFTGDAKADVAFWRPATGEWYVLRSEDSSFFSFPFGTTGDVPVAGDYDGDGKFDAGVFRPSSSTWFVQRSTAGTLIQTFGQSGDMPVPNAFVP